MCSSNKKKIRLVLPAVVVDIFNPSTQKTDTGETELQARKSYRVKTLSQKKDDLFYFSVMFLKISLNIHERMRNTHTPSVAA